MCTGWKVKSRASRKRNKETRGLFSLLHFFFPHLLSSLSPSPLPPPSPLRVSLSRARSGFPGWRTRAAWQPLTENSNWLYDGFLPFVNSLEQVSTVRSTSCNPRQMFHVRRVRPSPLAPDDLPLAQAAVIFSVRSDFFLRLREFS